MVRSPCSQGSVEPTGLPWILLSTNCKKFVEAVPGQDWCNTSIASLTVVFVSLPGFPCKILHSFTYVAQEGREQRKKIAGSRTILRKQQSKDEHCETREETRCTHRCRLHDSALYAAGVGAASFSHQSSVGRNRRRSGRRTWPRRRQRRRRGMGIRAPAAHRQRYEFPRSIDEPAGPRGREDSDCRR